MSMVVLDHTYSAVLAQLRQRLREPAPGRVQLLTGPRQVGKTTLLGEVEAEGDGRTLYVAADAPEAVLPGWWELQWQRARELAAGRGTAILLLDEVQYLPGWSRLLKHEADRLRRERTRLHVVVTGSSALEVGAGARESMAGRFERLRLLHWPAAELVGRLGMCRAEAPGFVVTHGGCPGAVAFAGDERRYRRYVLDSIVEPAVGRDLLHSESVRKPGMLRQVFAVAAGHPAQVVALKKIQGALQDRGSLSTVAHYLDLLGEACLVAAVPKFSRHVVRQRAAPPKLIVLNNALLGTAQAPPPSPDGDPARFGHWVENACAALALNCGQQVTWWRDEPHEVDFVSEGSWGRLAVEVKTGVCTALDFAGLLEFRRRFPDIRPLVLCDAGRESVAARLHLPVQDWKDYLLSGPPPE